MYISSSMSSLSKIPRVSLSSNSDMELDRISNLPGNVVDQILSYLHIKEAVKTSILSKKWRYKYSTLPSLVFDHRSFPITHEEIGMDSNLVSIIDHVLLLNSGPMHKFELSIFHTIPDNQIDKWILHLSRRRLKELVLSLSRYDGILFRIPSSMFSYQSLTHLKLSICSLRPPSTFSGFKNLKSLCFCGVDIDRVVLEYLISSSPVLETFTLVNCRDIKQLCIDAPNLQQLAFVGFCLRLSLRNTSHLTCFTMDISIRDKEFEGGIYWENLLASMPQIRRLNLEYFCLQCMTNDEVPTKISVQLVHLHHLTIGVNLTRSKETLYLLSLLKCAPNLQELHISFMRGDNCESSYNIWNSDDWNPPLSLWHIKIICVSGLKVEMDFINFLLSTSFALEKMTIQLSSYLCAKRENITEDQAISKMEKQLLSFSRASTKAKIIIL